MPAINPNDYNIDNLNSQILGPISVTDFRNYVLNHNLSGVNPEVSTLGFGFYPRGVYAADLWNPVQTVQDVPNLFGVSFIASEFNNNTTPRPDNIANNLWTNLKPFYGNQTIQEEYTINSKALSNPGSIDVWLEGTGFETEVTTIRDVVNLSNNEYGPEFVVTYNNPDKPIEATGYKQYPTNAGSDVIGPIIGKTLGFSSTSFVDFPSEMETISDERRATELTNRIKLNFVEDTVGNLNLDPIGLLSGQKIFTPNYSITRPKNFIGKAAEFTANLAGFNLPTSIIPGDSKTKLGSNAFQHNLLDYTGGGQKDLLYANVYSSKYTPDLLVQGNAPSDAKFLGKVGEFFDNLGRKKGGDTYLNIGEKTDDGDKKTLAQKVGNFVNGLITPQGDAQLIPSPEKDTNPKDPMVSMGIDGKYNALEGMDDNSRFNSRELDAPGEAIAGANIDYKPNKTTLIPSMLDSDDPNSSFTHQTPSANKIFDWRNRDKSVANRGLLKYTQDMINNAEANGHRGGAKFIGRFNSNSNLIQAEKDVGDGQTVVVPKHKDVSMGNLVRGGVDNSFYCRSWSARNPYQNHYDLIRSDKLYRSDFINDLSVLEESGHVKIGPYATDSFGASQTNSSLSTLANRSNDVKKYMFSLENLAWKDAPQKLGLPDCELGPNGGRIMWFPPYDISFTDNTSVNWEQNNFIGRAEPIYTYNNTDRKGTLSFSVITDHPSVINQMKGESEEYLYKFFAGCGIDLSDFFGEEIIQEVIEEEKIIADTEKTPEPVVPTDEVIPPSVEPKEPPFKELECYFRNARRSTLDANGYRVGDGRDIEEELTVEYELTDAWKTDKNNILELNKDFVDKVGELEDFLATKDGQNWGAEFIGYTSAAAPGQYNEVLSIDRAESVFRYVTSKVKLIGETNGATQYSTGYTYNPNNFGKQGVGFVCQDTQENCRKATEDGKLTFKDLKIWQVNPNPPFTTRWVVNAKAEEGSNQVDGDGNSISEENNTFGDSNPDSEEAKENRKVKIRLFKHEEYIINNTIIKMDTKKVQTIESNVNKEPIGLPDPLPLVSIDNSLPPILGSESQTEDIFSNDKEVQFLAGIFGTKPIKETTEIGTDIESEEILKKTIKKTVQKLFTECTYFEKIKKSDPFVYATINEKIKHFSPAFHSMTPEGFNSRLTFLHQCTRQGPSIRENESITQNMAFGRPPIAILRIGDFYYSKIVIDSLNINYEPLQWDMNPEGIGVQPQIAKIDLNFSFIGGSSIAGPIRQLQNAVSENFFANTSVFNPRRYYNSDNSKYKTLEEMLEDAARIETDGNNVIGFGSFKSQEDADKEHTYSKGLKTDEKDDQTTDVQSTDASGEELGEELFGDFRGGALDFNNQYGGYVITKDENGEDVFTNVGGGQFVLTPDPDSNEETKILKPVGNWTIANATLDITINNDDGTNIYYNLVNERSIGLKVVGSTIKPFGHDFTPPPTNGTGNTYNRLDLLTIDSKIIIDTELALETLTLDDLKIDGTGTSYDIIIGVNVTLDKLKDDQSRDETFESTLTTYTLNYAYREQR